MARREEEVVNDHPNDARATTRHPLDPITLTPAQLRGLEPLRAVFRDAYDALDKIPQTDAKVWAEARLREASAWAARAYAEACERGWSP